MLVTSIFSFSQNVFYPFRIKFQFLTHYQTTKSLQTTISNLTKMEESYPSKRVENTVGKGEIARYEQFLLFPQCFQKACFPEASEGVIVWEWVK